MNKIMAVGIVFLLMFMFPLMLNNAHAVSYTSIQVSADSNDQVIVNGSLISAHYGWIEFLNVPYGNGVYDSISVNSASSIFITYGSSYAFSYFVPAGSMAISSMYDGQIISNIFVVKFGDYLYQNHYVFNSYGGWYVQFGLFNLTASYGSVMYFNVGIMNRNGTSGILSYAVSGTRTIGEMASYFDISSSFAGVPTNPYAISPPFAVPATISGFYDNQSGAVSGVTVGEAVSGFNVTVSGQVNLIPPNATLNVYSNVQPLTIKVSTPLFNGANQQFIAYAPYPYSISIIQGIVYSISGIFNDSGVQKVISYTFTAKSTNNLWFNFSISSTSSGSSAYVSNISVGYPKALHYNINYLKNGNYQGGVWYININGTQYAIEENMIYIKEYYNTSPYSVSIIFGDYIYGGLIYSPSIQSYSISSTSNNTVYVVYYNITNTYSYTQNLTVFGLNEFDVIGGIVVFVALMLPAVAISLGNRKGGK